MGGRGGVAPDGAQLPADLALLSALAAVGARFAGDRALYTWFTLQSAIDVWRGRGGAWKGRGPRPWRDGHERARISPRARTTARRTSRSPPSSSKPRHRAAIMAFYRFAAPPMTSPTTRPCPRRTGWPALERMRRTPGRESDAGRGPSLALRRALKKSGGPPAPCTASNPCLSPPFPPRRQPEPLCRLGRADGLLPLFRAPVGRFVLDVHGEARTTWPANDALCAALQVVNHLQDCAKDYRGLTASISPKS